ncbi:hypothetical protein N0O92_08845 [Alkalihalobacillus sp. MEB130]|uniref:hypothetical protein n=1 Tax=Alkalihalobacillus sp. MEB130 TaxID=2976704 RepID=UPI0028DEFEF1|nr:hypothetical protein [Alkalihalobacillus sp. MEB130]MDT8860339.1 hypothetical protein [Alkalihalobacillus sp. MEB130]
MKDIKNGNRASLSANSHLEVEENTLIKGKIESYFRSDLIELKEKYEQELTLNRKFSANMADLKVEIATIQGKLLLEQEKNLNFQTENTFLKEENSKLGNKVDSFEKMLADKVRTIEKLDENNKSNFISQIDLKEKLDAQYNRNKELSESFTDLQKSYSQIEGELNREREKNSDLLHEELLLKEELVYAIKQLKVENENSQQDLEKQNQLLSELKSVYSKLRQEIERVESLKSELDEVKKVQSVKVNQSERKLKIDMEKLNDKKEVNLKLQAKIKKMNVEIKEVKRKISVANKQKVKAKKMYERIKGSRTWRYTAPLRSMLDKIK